MERVKHGRWRIRWLLDRRRNFRGVPDQDFQNPAGTGFTGLFHEIRPDNPVSFCRIIRPEPDYLISKFFYHSAKIMRSDENEKIASLKRHLTVFHTPAAKK